MILKKPVVTEKSYANQLLDKYSFWVDLLATKTQIKSAFHKAFGVKALSVNTTISHGKTKLNPKTRAPQSKSDLKKAIIRVPKGTKLDILSLAKAQK